MKWTIGSLVLLALVVGLAMVQVDSNTESRFQPLNEAEMLTTRGANTPCADYIIVNWSGSCYSSGCVTSPGGAYQQYASRHAICGAQGSSSSRDCKTGTYNQECGHTRHYESSWCISWFYVYSTYLYTNEVWSQPGCN